MVSTLTREGGMVAPDRMSGDDIEALASGGLFRLRGILIGTIAFQTYAGVLSVRLPGHSIKDGRRGRRAGFRCQPRSRRQHAADPTIAAVGRPDLSACPTSIRTSRLLELSNKNSYKVEFLTNRSSDDYMDQPARMPALGGASADPLRFLEFLIRDPVRTVVLHKSGIPVTVPDPSRYAVHKLIVASRRHNDGQSAVKRDKDIRQAGILFEAILQTRRSSDLALVYNEAWQRGDAWRAGIRAGAAMLPDEGRKHLKACLRTGAVEIDEDVSLPF